MSHSSSQYAQRNKTYNKDPSLISQPTKADEW